MTLTVRPVTQDYVAQTWPLVERFIAETLPYSGDDYTLDQIKVYLSKGLWTLLVAVDENKAVQGAAAVMFQNYPNDRVAFVTTMGGKILVNEDVLGKLKDILKQFGATKIQGAMRPSMVRLSKQIGFVERYTIVEVKI